MNRSPPIRDWSDSYRVGPVVLKLKAVGNLLGWVLHGEAWALSPAERVLLAAVVRERVMPGVAVDYLVDAVIEATRGGLGRTLNRSGVVYVDRL